MIVSFKQNEFSFRQFPFALILPGKLAALITITDFGVNSENQINHHLLARPKPLGILYLKIVSSGLGLISAFHVIHHKAQCLANLASNPVKVLTSVSNKLSLTASHH